MSGYHQALYAAAAIALAGSIVAVATVRKVRHDAPVAAVEVA